MFPAPSTVTPSGQLNCAAPPVPSALPDTRHWPAMHGKLVGAAKLEVEHFFDCVMNDKTPLVTGEDARQSLEVMLAAEKSISEGRIIQLPLPA